MTFKSVYIVKRPGNNDSVDYIEESIHAAAISCGVEFGRLNLDEHSLVVAIGGDGTMLEAMRRAVLSGAAAIGINVGRVGFLTDVNLDGKPGSMDERLMWSFFVQLFKSEIELTEEKRTVLKHNREDWQHTDRKFDLAVNEFSISRTDGDCMIEYSLKIDGFDGGVHRANSILFSSSTGSTAYALSAGGALMLPSVPAIQIVPVAPLTLTSRPLIVNPESRIEVAVWGDGITLRGDGNVLVKSHDSFTVEKPFRFVFQAFPERVRVLHLKNWDFFDVLHQKLGWIKRV